MGHPEQETIGLGGLRYAVAQIMDLPAIAIMFALVGVVMLLLLRLILRKNWLAYGAWVILGVVLLSPRVGSSALDLTTVLIMMLAGIVILTRFGLLTLVVR